MEESKELSWIVHPIRHRHGKTALLLVVAALTCAALWISTGSLLWVLFALLVIGAGVRHYLFPTHYRLSEDQVESRILFYTRKVPWDKLKSHYRDRNGVLLSPFAFPTRLENFRGIYLLFGDNADQVMEFVTRKIAPSEESREKDRT